jgi:AcrR family transcriptional regulator
MNSLVTARRSASQVRAKITVERCLEACRELLTEYGFEKLTMSAVALSAGIAMGTLYQYFADRTALLEVLLERHNAAVGVGLEAALDDVDDLDDLIVRMIALSDNYFDLHEHDRFVRALWTGVQGDDRLQMIDIEDTRRKASRAAKLSRRAHRGINPSELTARWFVVLQSTLYAARLAALSSPDDRPEMRKTFQLMATAALRATG